MPSRAFAQHIHQQRPLRPPPALRGPDPVPELEGHQFRTREPGDEAGVVEVRLALAFLADRCGAGLGIEGDGGVGGAVARLVDYCLTALDDQDRGRGDPEEARYRVGFAAEGGEDARDGACEVVDCQAASEELEDFA
ncbi:hypothetical protein LTR53_017985 [Teratosphaeriaceae sp. CCFEE 6253]|nr:hypothetical protein LTR53_017985 [Teratosphaeriaceae sp. CCFEE 6253]